MELNVELPEDTDYALPRVVARALRRSILVGALRPGQRLTAGDVARRFGMSHTPVRDALKLLADEGLVTLLPRRGAFVACLSEKDVKEVFELRLALEGLSARIVGESPDREEKVNALEEVLARMVGIDEEEGDDLPSALDEADMLFHDALCRLSGNARLWDAWQRIRNLITLFIRESRVREPDPVPVYVEMHRSLLEAIRGGDKNVIEQAVWTHVRYGAHILDQSL